MKVRPKKSRDAADYSGIIKRIKPVEALPFRLTAIAFGRSGTGKTTFAATFPKPLLLLDIKEDGTDSVMDVKGIDVIRITHWDEIEQVYWYLKHGKHKYRSVVIDAVTEMQDLAIAKYREESKLGDEDLLSRRIWGQVSGLMKTWLINYRDLTAVENVLYIAHDRSHDSDDEGGDQLIPEIGPRLMPSVATHLAGAVKVIGNTFIRETKEKLKDRDKKKRSVEYRMRIGPHAYYVTKIRQPKSNFIPDSIVNPTYDKIVSIIEGKYQPSNKSKTKRSK